MKVINITKGLISKYLFQYPRILKYKFLSNCKGIHGNPKLYQPTQFIGKGDVIDAGTPEKMIKKLNNE